LLPLVENAFKHVSHYKDATLNKIHIQLKQEDKQFIAEVYNTYDKTIAVKHLVNSGGLGIQNLKRRLELLYPDAHVLRIEQTENDFHTLLKISCND
jgi:LytS/YehU family sensor histidine kinase